MIMDKHIVCTSQCREFGFFAEKRADGGPIRNCDLGYTHREER
jgi:hypothetical protein